MNLVLTGIASLLAFDLMSKTPLWVKLSSAMLGAVPMAVAMPSQNPK